MGLVTFSQSPIFAGGATEWGEFLHLPGRMFTDFTEIRDEIIRETGMTI
jgi:hypothetical protein